ncbi:FAD-dependent oxidoreductase [Actinomycetospora chiangmaiensis]|uniref:FAD-dependent oxidoreductase n=1 Tax=Actinomycetospora chiangmaiensis TaxID=402650 RepID=UPI00035F380D|nr:NAD(P)/FAD-dependent oxidoreductase [Actinomycetospora chiangmaiensis]
MTTLAVIGAGPAGLTLARVVQRLDAPFDVVVLDRDRGPDDRPQGGTLDMHVGSGQTALERAGLLDVFHAVARPEGQDMRLLAHTGEALVELVAAPDDTANPEIDRGDLRALLLDSLRPGTVRWNARLDRVDGDLVLDDGSRLAADVVVGADGAWSRVRPLLSPAQPAYSGVTFVEFRLPGIDVRRPDLAALVGRGSMSAPYANRSLIAQRNARGVVRGYAALRCPLGTPGLDDRTTLLAHFADYDDALTDLVRAADDGFVVRPIMALDVPHVWEHVPGVTLLGDAAHLMSPFSGLGANLAMLDGSDLALALVEHGPEGIAAYEDLMFPRSEVAARGAAEGIANAIAPDAPAHSLRHLARLQEA